MIWCPSVHWPSKSCEKKLIWLESEISFYFDDTIAQIRTIIWLEHRTRDGELLCLICIFSGIQTQVLGWAMKVSATLTCWTAPPSHINSSLKGKNDRKQVCLEAEWLISVIKHSMSANCPIIYDPLKRGVCLMRKTTNLSIYDPWLFYSHLSKMWPTPIQWFINFICMHETNEKVEEVMYDKTLKTEFGVWLLI